VDEDPAVLNPPPTSPGPTIELEGQPPENALDIQIARQGRMHELTLAPAGFGETIDVSKPFPPGVEEFDVVVETADGSRAEWTAGSVGPLRIPYSDQPFTVTYAPAAGQPDVGTLTVEFNDGSVTGEARTGQRAPELAEHRLVYEVSLTWTHDDPGYAVVLRGPGTGTSSRHFTQVNEFHLSVGAGERMAIAVYPGFPDAEAAQSAPAINPVGDVSTIVVTRD
jgi:hypothetical protein